MPALNGESMPQSEHLFFNDRGQQSVIWQGRWKLLIEPGWSIHTSRKTTATAQEPAGNADAA